MHVHLGQGVLPHAPWHFFDHDPALFAVDPTHVIDQKDQIAPDPDELKVPRRVRLVVTGRGLMTDRANGTRTFPRTDWDEDVFSVVGETGSLVNETRDGMTLVHDSGKPHERIERIRNMKLKTNLHSPSLPPPVLLPYCPDLQDWPERWMAEEKDLPPGRRIVEYFTPFLLHLATSGLSKRTIQKHVDNMWLLGGEIIRDLNEDSSLRKVAVEQLFRKVVDQDGGPLIHNGSEDDQRSFDSTCRKFHRFLTQSYP